MGCLLVGMNCGEREDEQDDVEAVRREWRRPRLLGGVAHECVTSMFIVQFVMLFKKEQIARRVVRNELGCNRRVRRCGTHLEQINGHIRKVTPIHEEVRIPFNWNNQQ